MALLGGKKEVIVPDPPKLDGKVTAPEAKAKVDSLVRVRFLKQGRLNGVRHDAGEVREVPESHLEHYLAIGAAELHKPAPKAPPAPQVFIHKKAAER